MACRTMHSSAFPADLVAYSGLEHSRLAQLRLDLEPVAYLVDRLEMLDPAVVRPEPADPSGQATLDTAATSASQCVAASE